MSDRKTQGNMKRFAVVLIALLAGCATVPPPAPAPAPRPGPTPPPAVTPETAPAPAPVVPPPTELPAAPEAPAAPPRPKLTFRDFVELNDTKLVDVYRGMSMATVDKYMSTHQTEQFRNPYKRQILHAKDGTLYEVVFYLTRVPYKGKPITERQLTPVIYRDDKVMAIGHYRLKKLRQSLAAGLAPTK
jgi:hypothetical protein